MAKCSASRVQQHDDSRLLTPDLSLTPPHLPPSPGFRYSHRAPRGLPSHWLPSPRFPPRQQLHQPPAAAHLRAGPSERRLHATLADAGECSERERLVREACPTCLALLASWLSSLSDSVFPFIKWESLKPTSQDGGDESVRRRHRALRPVPGRLRALKEAVKHCGERPDFGSSNPSSATCYLCGQTRGLPFLLQ